MCFYRKAVFIVLFLFSVSYSFAAQAGSVWEISKGGNTLYLAGTMHLLTPEDYPLPKSYDQAYSASDIIVFETDMDGLNTVEFQQKTQKFLMYSDGTTLDNVLSPRTLEKLKAYFSDRSLPYSSFQVLKPSLMGVTLGVIELQRMGLNTEGVDAFYFRAAKKDGKSREWFETPEEQLYFIANIAKGKEDEFISYTLDDIKNWPVQMNILRKAWRAGDLKTMEDVGLAQLREDYPDMYEALIVKRNNNWMPKIYKMLSTPAIETVLVGALHIPGEHGLLSQLSNNGYSIRKLASE